MICPYCGEPLEMYEEWQEDRDGETVKTEEHWQCTNCHRIFSRQATYRIVEKGMLEE